MSIADRPCRHPLPLLVLALILPARLPAADPVQSVIRTSCVECHDAELHKGDLRLDTLKPVDQDPGTLALWMKIQDRVAEAEMPPKKKLSAADTASFTTALGRQVLAAEAARRRTEGRVPLRRLNRVEFEHALEDIFAITDLEVKEVLPPDPISFGFDNVAAVQELSYVQIGRYLEAADSALDAAMALRPKPELRTERQKLQESGFFNDEQNGKRVPGGRGETRHVDEWVVFIRQKNNAQGQWLLDNKFDEPGLYRFRIRCRGVELDSKGTGDPKDDRLLPPTVAHVAALQIADGRFLHFFDVPAEAGVVEFTAYLHGRERLSLFCASLDDRTNGGEREIPRKPYKGPGIAVDWIDMEGPLLEQWPPPSHQRLFGDLPLAKWERASGIKEPEPAMIGTGVQRRSFRGAGGPFVVMAKNPEQDSELLLRRFMERAYRRPVEAGEVRRYQALALAALTDKRCFQDAMRIAYKSVLCAPDFLFLRETPGRLDGAALATRLALFLWRSLPDDALMQQARSGALLRPEVLRAETERLLKDARSGRFIADFADQWLDLARIYDTVPDRQLYPEYFCDNHLVESMIDETRAYLGEMISGDLGVRYAVSGDFTMVNERLAQLYGIPGVQGCALRRVALPKDSPRGGFITQASVLKVTANGTTTSPVKRGAWILERLLGKASPPPPADAGAIEPDTRGTTTIREQLDKHRANASCATCHQKIDPPGFALEAFDVMGAFRERYRSLGKGDEARLTIGVRNVRFRVGPPVESTGEAGGSATAGIAVLRQALLRDEAQLARNLLQRLVTYATGAGVGIADRPLVESMLADAKARKYGLRTLIHAVVQSDLFRNK
jgi:hypothetical protein